MLTFNQYLTEIFDHPAPYTMIKSHDDMGGGFKRYHFSVKDKNNNDHNIRVEVEHYESLKEEFTPPQNPVSVNAYHGSGRLFKKFSVHGRTPNDFYGGGAYFTSDKSVAHTYAKSMAKTQNGEPHIYHTTLNMKNVFDVKHKFTGDHLKHVLPHESEHEDFARGAGLLKYGTDRHKVLHDLKHGKIELTGEQVFRGLSKGLVKADKAKAHLQSKGYTGLVYDATGAKIPGESGYKADHRVHIAWNPDDITINKVTKLVRKPKPVNEALKWDIPAEPGTTPIPPDHVRLFHQTNSSNLRSIRRTGINFDHARGIEGPKAIYASPPNKEGKGFYGHPNHTPTIEFHVHKDNFKSPFVQGDVDPKNIIAVHNGTWHHHARYIEAGKKDGLLDSVVKGEYDHLLKDKEYGHAIRYIKHKYSKV